MLDLVRARIPLLPLFLSAACQPKVMDTSGTDTGAGATNTSGSDTGAPTSTSNPDTSSSDTGASTSTSNPDTGPDPSQWPSVECGDKICPAGQICVDPPPACEVVPSFPCETDGTTGYDTGSSTPCYVETETQPKCRPVPRECLEAEDGKLCVETSDELCSYGGEFSDDSVLRCKFNTVDLCEEGDPPYGYCPSCYAAGGSKDWRRAALELTYTSASSPGSR